MTAKFIALDTETGGVSASEHTLLSVAFLILDEHLNEIDKLELFLKPSNGVYSVQAEAMKVNRINLVTHDDAATSVKDGYQQLKLFLDYHNPGGRSKLIAVGHNVKFDIDFLKAQLLNEHKGLWDQYVAYRVLDTATIAQFMKLTGHLNKEVSGSLQSILNYYGVTDVSNDHTALGDARATVEALKLMLDDAEFVDPSEM